jgi:hypothetical protein
MRRNDPLSTGQWEDFVEGLGFEAPPPLAVVAKLRRELWREYAAVFADDRAKELYTNIVVFEPMRRDPPASPQCPAYPRVDGRRRAVQRGTVQAVSRAAPPASDEAGPLPPFAGVIQRFLEERLPSGCPQTGVLSGLEWDGVGFLRPGLVPPALEPTTLEIHRRVIALERVGVDLMQLLFSAFVSRGARHFLDPDDVADAEAAFEFQGGVAGDGSRYWAADADRADSHASAGLYRSLCYLRANRAAAFRRRYVVADDGAWGLPVFARLHTLCCAGPVDRATLERAVEQLVADRRGAVLADRIGLVRYGAHMTHYCMRLQVILRQLAVRVPPSIAVERFPADPEGCVAGVLVEQTRPLSDEEADLIVRDRLDVERVEIGATLATMGIPYRDALVYVHVVTQGVQLAMGTDGHRHHKTCFLHASPALPAAQYAAYMYATGVPVE